ncbi:2-amino-4-hydroxy-6-hydroxymethyldihydropteridine diphosphokinase [Sedimentitalea sp. CAU 1593]|uniref:2-amino-4-hydroxy-6-hydroxymethyldihydropteridine pyrophosphokinase n=2 Tax=Sedimentitalea arenosa TaxID=2798803 RepID=A0A8J7IW88_9RHOB|nr:2-amino-4-hydroxy-6-hydroxymethyldihydropteridine diphosphokinase [Arenibacterium arenosum]
MMESRSRAVIALGGNLPFQDALTTTSLIGAVRRLSCPEVMIRAVSRFYATPCFPPGAGPDYVNAAVLVATLLSPAALLQRLHEIEAVYGRERVQRWGMRTLDLDLLTWEDAVLPDRKTHEVWRDLPPAEQVGAVPDGLVLPHPRLQDRAFALVPLCDVLPDWTHPVLNRSARALCDALPRDQVDSVRPL